MFARGRREIVVEFGPLNIITVTREELEQTIKQRVEQVRTKMATADWKEIISIQFDEVD